MSSIVGIDEAGRGPLAGPVAVGVVRIRTDLDPQFFRGIKDSKKLTAEKREHWFGLALEGKSRGDLDFCVSLVSQAVIDKHGIAYAIRLGIKRCLIRLKAEESDQIFLDGGIHAPALFTQQQTIIKGDEKIAVISLASICAKVTRDRYMVRIGKSYPEYGFAEHKGYGTTAHCAAIRKFGPQAIHRKSFLSKFGSPTSK